MEGVEEDMQADVVVDVDAQYAQDAQAEALPQSLGQELGLGMKGYIGDVSGCFGFRWV
jgi:hypothetical protein